MHRAVFIYICSLFQWCTLCNPAFLYPPGNFTCIDNCMRVRQKSQLVKHIISKYRVFYLVFALTMVYNYFLLFQIWIWFQKYSIYIRLILVNILMKYLYPFFGAFCSLAVHFLISYVFSSCLVYFSLYLVYFYMIILLYKCIFE